MNKKTIGLIATALLIGAMIVMTVKSNISLTDSNENMTAGTLIDSPNVETGLNQGETPPNFELTTLTGEPVKLSDYKGKKVILNFWASWCPPCKAEMPYMEKYYNENKESENVEIIAVNMTSKERGGTPNIEKFVNAYGLTFPIPLDETGEVMEAYGAISPPMTYMLNTDGTIAHIIRGPIDEKMMAEQVEGMH